MAQQQINGTQILIGTPDDGSYGVTPSNINVPGVLSTDNLPSAIDKLISIIDKLAPSKSPGLSTKYLSPQTILGPYSARHAGTNSVWVPGFGSTSSAIGTVYNSIYTTSNPVVNVSDVTTTNGVLATFSDGQSGVLVAKVDGNTVGYRTLDSGYYGPGVPGSPDVNTWNSSGTSGSGGLTITFDQDPYSSAPNTGFWTSLKATMSSTYSFSKDGSEHYYNMSHTTTGTIASNFKFIYDDDKAPQNGLWSSIIAISGVTFSLSLSLFTQSSTKWTSGVPSLSVNDYVMANYAIPNDGGLVSRFYNSTTITRFNLNATTTVTTNDTTSGLPFNGYPSAYQNPYRVTGITATVAGNMFTPSPSFDTLFTISLLNPLNTNVTNTITGIYFGSFNPLASGKKLYIDTVSNEAVRVRSGDGQYPSFGSGPYDFGGIYTSTLSSYSINNNGTYPEVCGELMLQNGIFRVPFGNWTVNYPVIGPNYGTLSNNGVNAYQNPSLTYWRWVTFNAGSVLNVASFVITINGSINLTSSGTSPYVTTPTTFGIYVRVTGVTGWLDLNKIYSSGNPLSDGANCYDNTYSLKSATVRRVTLGPGANVTGTVYVRIGLPTTSPITFTGVTKS